MSTPCRSEDLENKTDSRAATCCNLARHRTFVSSAPRPCFRANSMCIKIERSKRAEGWLAEYGRGGNDDTELKPRERAALLLRLLGCRATESQPLMTQNVCRRGGGRHSLPYFDRETARPATPFRSSAPRTILYLRGLAPPSRQSPVTPEYR